MIIVDLTPVIVNMSYLCILFLVFVLYHPTAFQKQKKMTKCYDSPAAKLVFSCVTPMSSWKPCANSQFRSKRTCRRWPVNDDGSHKTVRRQLFKCDGKVAENPVEKVDEGFDIDINRKMVKNCDSPPPNLNLSCSTPVSECPRPNFQRPSKKTRRRRPLDSNNTGRTIGNELFKCDGKKVEKPCKQFGEDMDAVKKEIQKQINRQRSLRL